MARPPSHDQREREVKKGPWTPEEDRKLTEYIEKHGVGSWKALPSLAGLNRCGKSCRLRWINYLRPDIKRGKFSEEEEDTIIQLHSKLGNRWSAIATYLKGRTDNEIKNHWNTHLRKQLLRKGIDPITHEPRADLALMSSLPSLISLASNLYHGSNGSATDLINALALQSDLANLAKLQLAQTLIQVLSTFTNPPPNVDALSLVGSRGNCEPNKIPGSSSLLRRPVDDNEINPQTPIDYREIISQDYGNSFGANHTPNNNPTSPISGGEILNAFLQAQGLEGTPDHISTESTNFSTFSGTCELDPCVDDNLMASCDLFVGGSTEQDTISYTWGAF